MNRLNLKKIDELLSYNPKNKNIDYERDPLNELNKRMNEIEEKYNNKEITNDFIKKIVNDIIRIEKNN